MIRRKSEKNSVQTIRNLAAKLNERTLRDFFAIQNFSESPERRSLKWPSYQWWGQLGLERCKSMNN